VMRQDDRVPLPLERENRRDVVGQDRPLERRNVPLDAFIELRKRRRDPGGLERGLQHGHLRYAQIEHLSSPEKPGRTCPAFRYAAYENKASKTVVKMSSKQPALSFSGRPRPGRELG